MIRNASLPVRAPAPSAEKIPLMLMRAVLVLVLSVLTIVSIARLTGQPVIATPPVGVVVQERAMILRTHDLSGAVEVLNPDGSLIVSLPADKGGFVAGIARVVERERLKNRVPNTGPVTVIRQDNGRLSVTDPSTGWSADLMGFGADNAKAFARLLAN